MFVGKLNRQKGIERSQNPEVKAYADYRELLAKEKPDIVIVATPDHWHALPTIAAVKAGAHVYVEKPIAHTIAEGRAMVKAARAAGRVVQVGTHRRTSPHTIQAREFIRSGKVGQIGMMRCFVNTGGSGPEKPSPTLPVPAGLDWDAWCGPAPLRPYTTAIHPRGFRQYLDYANGTLRLTTRQTFQLHGVIKSNMRHTMQAINAAMLDTLAAWGVPIVPRLRCMSQA